eukprot:949043-Rhodomonas_salina.1
MRGREDARRRMTWSGLAAATAERDLLPLRPPVPPCPGSARRMCGLKVRRESEGKGRERSGKKRGGGRAGGDGHRLVCA